MESYVVMLTEVANSRGDQVSSPFNVSAVSGGDLVSVTVSALDGLLLGRHYNVTIFAVNSVGSSVASSVLSMWPALKLLCTTNCTIVSLLPIP